MAKNKYKEKQFLITVRYEARAKVMNDEKIFQQLSKLGYVEDYYMVGLQVANFEVGGKQ